MRCKVCDAYIPEGAIQCLECGTPTEIELLCQRCGAPTNARARFCRKCGAPLKPDQEDIAQPPRHEPATGADLSQDRTCAKCGENVPAGIQYCPSCGTSQAISALEAPETERDQPAGSSDATAPTEDSEKCPACGAEPRGSGRFCYACGRFLGSDVEEIVCPACGAISSLRYSRCQHCGEELPAPSKTRK